MQKWPNEVPPVLRRRLEEVLSFRNCGPAEVWGVVKEWLDAQERDGQGAGRLEE